MRCGLLGKKLGHSYSPQIHGYLGNYSYALFEKSPEELEDFLKNGEFAGLNVTIPYKQQVIPLLDEMDETASQIGAVNVIKFIRKNNTLTLKGYNSDAIGFEQSLLPLLQSQHKKALVLGTGGASKAVSYILKKNGIEVTFISRTPKEGQISYQEITSQIMAEYKLIVNCTPLGMYPVDACPDIPYECLTSEHLLYDLIYNPEKTDSTFLLRCQV